MTAPAKNLSGYRLLDAHVAKGAVARNAAILRLDYIRVTACRTDFRSGLKPPGLIPLRFTHSFCHSNKLWHFQFHKWRWVGNYAVISR